MEKARRGPSKTSLVNSRGTTSQGPTTSSSAVSCATASGSSTGITSRAVGALKLKPANEKKQVSQAKCKASEAVTPVRQVKGGRAVLLNQSLDWGCCAAQAGVCVSQAVGRCGKSHAYRRSEWRTGVPAGGADRQTGMSAWPHGSSRT